MFRTLLIYLIKGNAVLILLTEDVIIGVLGDAIVHIAEPHLVGAQYCCTCVQIVITFKIFKRRTIKTVTLFYHALKIFSV